MRRKVLHLIFAVLLILPASVLASGHHVVHDRDGDDWLNWGPVMKTAFVEGFKAGSDYVIQSGDGVFALELPDRYDVRKAEKVQKELYDFSRLPVPKKEITFEADDVILLMTRGKAERKKAMLELSVAGYSTERMVEGIDSIYADYENRHIRIRDSIYYVRKKINGASADDLTRILNYLRSGREQSGWLVVYGDRGQVKRFIAFP